MIDAVTKPKTRVKTKTERPRLHKVILVNDDYTPREFVVTVLKAEFRMTGAPARCMRGRGLHQGCRRDQGDARHRRRPRQGLPAAVYHRAGGIAGRAERPLSVSARRRLVL